MANGGWGAGSDGVFSPPAAPGHSQPHELSSKADPKGEPLKKTNDTDAIFANIEEVRQEVRNDPETLEISIDTKGKVELGDYARGEKTRTKSDGTTEKGWDHDPPAKEKLVPFGILMLARGALTLIFGSRETSDARVDALQKWWRLVRPGLGHIAFAAIPEFS